MEVLFESDLGEYATDDDSKELYVECAIFAMSKMDIPENSELSLSFVSKDEIAALNEEFRGKEGPTDVLSFECDNLEDDFPYMQDGEGSEPGSLVSKYVLGDVIISPEVAIAQASEFGNTQDVEICMLIIHGILHLCGFDHIDDEDAKVMEPLQDSILEQWIEKKGL